MNNFIYILLDSAYQDKVLAPARYIKVLTRLYLIKNRMKISRSVALIFTSLHVLCAQSPPKSCFAQSRSTFGITSRDLSFTHKNRILDGDFTQEMQLSKVKGCWNREQRLIGIQFTLQDHQIDTSIFLSPIGYTNKIECDQLTVRNDDYVKELKIEWDTKGITLFGLTTDSNRYAQFGMTGTASNTFKFS